jgi:hypothetical protein
MKDETWESGTRKFTYVLFKVRDYCSFGVIVATHSRVRVISSAVREKPW